VRGIGDATGEPHPASSTLTPGWESALSPIGWMQATRPYAADDLRPVLLALVVGALAVWAALAVQRVRDVGAGLIAEGRARRTASPVLRGPFGLAARLQRGSVIGWGIGAVLLGLIGGDLADLVLEQLGSAAGVAEAVKRLGGSGSGVLDGFIIAIGGFVGILAAAIAVQGAMRLRQEEAAGGADAVLSGAVGRIRWFLTIVALAVAASALALVLAGLAAALAALAARPDGSAGTFGDWFGTIVWQLPAVLVILALVSLVFAVAPRATIPVGWLVLAAAAFLGELGALLDLPQWVRDLAPFSHSPAVALAHPSFTGAGWMTAGAVVAIALACVLLRRRDTVP
jgi:ABC-2 type transport system permease protein